ncbi:MAG: hypothetical protein GC134_01660 [Proteobacteria bacterium]|nr:hypothetical protein [Pseudomonadota bacterium]
MLGLSRLFGFGRPQPKVFDSKHPTWVHVHAVTLDSGNGVNLSTDEGIEVSLCRAETRCLMDILTAYEDKRPRVRVKLPSCVAGEEGPEVELLVLGQQLTDAGETVVEAESVADALKRQQEEGLARLGEVYTKAQLKLLDGIQLLLTPCKTGIGYSIPFSAGMNGCVRPGPDYASALAALRAKSIKLVMPEHRTIQ